MNLPMGMPMGMPVGMPMGPTITTRLPKVLGIPLIGNSLSSSYLPYSPSPKRRLLLNILTPTLTPTLTEASDGRTALMGAAQVLG